MASERIQFEANIKINSIDTTNIRAQLATAFEKKGVTLQNVSIAGKALTSMNRQIRTKVLDVKRFIKIGVSPSSITEAINQIQNQLFARPFEVKIRATPQATSSTGATGDTQAVNAAIGEANKKGKERAANAKLLLETRQSTLKIQQSLNAAGIIELQNIKASTDLEREKFNTKSQSVTQSNQLAQIDLANVDRLTKQAVAGAKAQFAAKKAFEQELFNKTKDNINALDITQREKTARIAAAKIAAEKSVKGARQTIELDTNAFLAATRQVKQDAKDLKIAVVQEFLSLSKQATKSFKAIGKQKLIDPEAVKKAKSGIREIAAEFKRTDRTASSAIKNIVAILNEQIKAAKIAGQQKIDVAVSKGDSAGIKNAELATAKQISSLRKKAENEVFKIRQTLLKRTKALERGIIKSREALIKEQANSQIQLGPEKELTKLKNSNIAVTKNAQIKAVNEIQKIRVRSINEIFDLRLRNLGQIEGRELKLAEKQIALDRKRVLLQASTKGTKQRQVISASESKELSRRLTRPFQDQISAIRQTNTAIGNHRASINSLGALVANTAKRFLAWTIGASAIFLIQRAIRATITSLIDFERKVIDVTKVLNLLDSEVIGVQRSIVQAAIDFKFSFDEAADAFIVFAQQGRSVAEVVDLARQSLLLANVSILTTAESTEALTAILNTFQIPASQAADAIDKLNEVANNFAVTEKDLTEALKRSGAAAIVSGVSFEELNALVTVLQETTRRGGKVIGTALKTIFARLVKPASIEALAELGVSVRTASGEARGAVDVLGDLAQTFDSLTSAQKQNIAITLTGVRRFSDLAALLRGFGKVNEVLAVQQEAQGSAAREQAKILNTLDKQVQSVRNQFNKFIQELGEAGLKPLISGFLSIGSAIGKLGTVLDSSFLFGAGFLLIAGGVIKSLGFIRDAFAQFLVTVSKGKGPINTLGLFIARDKELLLVEQQLTKVAGIRAAIESKTQATLGLTAAKNLKQQIVNLDFKNAEILQARLGIEKLSVFNQKALLAEATKLVGQEAAQVELASIRLQIEQGLVTLTNAEVQAKLKVVQAQLGVVSAEKLSTVEKIKQVGLTKSIGRGLKNNAGIIALTVGLGLSSFFSSAADQTRKINDGLETQKSLLQDVSGSVAGTTASFAFIGTTILPGWGTAIGAALGLITSLITNAAKLALAFNDGALALQKQVKLIDELKKAGSGIDVPFGSLKDALREIGGNATISNKIFKQQEVLVDNINKKLEESKANLDLRINIGDVSSVEKLEETLTKVKGAFIDARVEAGKKFRADIEQTNRSVFSLVKTFNDLNNAIPSSVKATSIFGQGLGVISLFTPDTSSIDFINNLRASGASLEEELKKLKAAASGLEKAIEFDEKSGDAPSFGKGSIATKREQLEDFKKEIPIVEKLLKSFNDGLTAQIDQVVNQNSRLFNFKEINNAIETGQGDFKKLAQERIIALKALRAEAKKTLIAQGRNAKDIDDALARQFGKPIDALDLRVDQAAIIKSATAAKNELEKLKITIPIELERKKLLNQFAELQRFVNTSGRVSGDSVETRQSEAQSDEQKTILANIQKQIVASEKLIKTQSAKLKGLGRDIKNNEEIVALNKELIILGQKEQTQVQKVNIANAETAKLKIQQKNAQSDFIKGLQKQIALSQIQLNIDKQLLAAGQASNARVAGGANAGVEALNLLKERAKIRIDGVIQQRNKEIDTIKATERDTIQADRKILEARAKGAQEIIRLRRQIEIKFAEEQRQLILKNIDIEKGARIKAANETAKAQRFDESLAQRRVRFRKDVGAITPVEAAAQERNIVKRLAQINIDNLTTQIESQRKALKDIQGQKVPDNSAIATIQKDIENVQIKALEQRRKLENDLLAIEEQSAKRRIALNQKIGDTLFNLSGEQEKNLVRNKGLLQVFKRNAGSFTNIKSLVDNFRKLGPSGENAVRNVTKILDQFPTGANKALSESIKRAFVVGKFGFDPGPLISIDEQQLKVLNESKELFKQFLERFGKADPLARADQANLANKGVADANLKGFKEIVDKLTGGFDLSKVNTTLEKLDKTNNDLKISLDLVTAKTDVLATILGQDITIKLADRTITVALDSTGLGNELQSALKGFVSVEDLVVIIDAFRGLGPTFAPFVAELETIIARFNIPATTTTD